jgi:aryl-alcohol dehydrogenase-like predicted oxidoreductase
MDYKLLGKSGLRVSEICLGTMTFGERWKIGASMGECRRILDAFADRGGNFVDTADVYGEGESEEILGELLAGHRHDWVIASKYSFTTAYGKPNGAGNQRKHLVEALEASLRRLKTDYVDLYYVHCWDTFTPVEETLRTLDDLVRSGKILYIGVSDTPAWIVAKSIVMAELRGWSRYVALQIPYNLLERTVERELLPMAKDLGLSVAVWGPLASGQLSGKYSGTKTRVSDRSIPALNEQTTAIVRELAACAEELGTSMSRLALKWVMGQDASIIPIIGARRIDQLTDNLGALDLNVPQAITDRLLDISRIEYGFPFDFFERDKHLDSMYAGILPRLQAKRNTAWNYMRTSRRSNSSSKGPVDSRRSEE